ncbi:MAG: signal peptidase I [Motilibacteraceae bacterium]
MGEQAPGEQAPSSAAEETPRHTEPPAGSGAGPGDAPADGGATAAGPRKGRQRSEGGSFLRELPFILVAALVLSLLIKTFLVQAFYIPSGSMENTLLVGDRVFVNKLTTRFGEVHRGDIVVFRDPANWLSENPAAQPTGLAGGVRRALEFVGLAPSSSDEDLIKRVIGVGGDTVACCDAEGRLTVNGVPLDEPYLYPGDVPSEQKFKVTVPQGELWVMGDHRSVSEDSRVHIGEPGGGFVPEDDVVGRAFVVVWPLDRFRTLHRPDTFSQPALSSH